MNTPRKLALFVPTLVVALALTGASVMAASGSANETKGHPKIGGTAQQMAAADSLASQCTKLEAQFDGAIKSHGSAAKAAEAKLLRQEGGQLCASGKAAAGVKKLEQALSDIGEKPMKAKN